MRRPSLLLCVGLMMGAWVVPAFAQDTTVAKGATLFAGQKCTICHSVQGKGGKKPLDGAGARLTADLVKLWITDPKAAEAKAGKKASPPMKSYAALPPADVDALVAYVMSLK